MRLEENTDNMKNFFSEIDRIRFSLGWEPRDKWSEDVVGKLCEKARRKKELGSALIGRV